MSNDGRAKVEPFAIVVVLVLFTEHMLLGGWRHDLALAFAAVHFLLLLGLVLASGGAQPPRLPLRIPAALTGLVFALGVVSILPLGPPLAHPMWSYVGAVGVTWPGSISLDPVGTRHQLVALAGYVALFVCGAAIGMRRESADRFSGVLTLAGAAFCVWSICMFILSPKTLYGQPKAYFIDRLSGSFVSPNVAGTLFACFTVVGLAGVLRPFLRDRKPGQTLRLPDIAKTWPEAVLLLLALACMFLTASRGALMAAVAGVMALMGLAVWMKSSRRSLAGGLVSVMFLLLTLGAAFYVFGAQTTAQRIGATALGAEDRLTLFATYWKAALASPWTGYGLGAFGSINMLSINAQNAMALSNVDFAHNVYLQWLLQMGFPGALAMTGAVATILAGTVRGVARRSTQQSLGLACIGVAVVFIVHGLTDFAFEVPSMGAFFSVMLGVGFGLAERPAGGRRSGR